MCKICETEAPIYVRPCAHSSLREAFGFRAVCHQCGTEGPWATTKQRAHAFMVSWPETQKAAAQQVVTQAQQQETYSEAEQKE